MAIYDQNYHVEEKESSKGSLTIGANVSVTQENEQSVVHKRSVLVDKCAPPKKPADYPIHYVFIASAILTSTLPSYLPLDYLLSKFQLVTYAAIFVGSFYVLNKGLWFLLGDGIMKKDLEYMRRVQAWEKKWYCLRCGTLWIEDDKVGK